MTKADLRPFTLGHLTVERLSPPVLVEQAAHAGFKVIGIRFWDGFTNKETWPMRPGSPMLRETMKGLADTGLKVPEIENIVLQPGTNVADYAPMFEVGAVLGARRVVIGSVVDDESRCTDLFARLCEIARPFNLDIAIEFYLKWHGCASFEQGCRIIRNAGQGNGKLLVDALHLNRSGGTPALLKTVPAEIYASLQICDAPAARPASLDDISVESRFERKLPGQGGLPLEEVLRAWPADAPLGIEIPMRSLEDSIGSQAFLKQCFDTTVALLERASAPQAQTN
jgi:sugar phosphate isomerase/epimerase